MRFEIHIPGRSHEGTIRDGRFDCSSIYAFPQSILAETRDGVYIHITHGPDEPHQVVMALRMAELMSEDNDVLVNFDMEAVEVVL